MNDRVACRRFPPPWSVVEVAEAFVVVDAAGTRLAFVYFDLVERGANSTRKLKPEALKIATSIAALPDLLRGAKPGDMSHLPPGPWIVHDRHSWFPVEDVGGLLVAAVYVGEGTSRLTWDEARRIAANIARLWAPNGRTAGTHCNPPSTGETAAHSVHG